MLQGDVDLRGTVQAVGLAGPADAAAMHNILEAILPRVPRVEHSEGELGLARYDVRQGIALVAGTGASCHAIDAAGRRSAIGGYGPQFGDEGSAYWIAKAGLQAAFRAEQGRIDATRLLDVARDFFHIASPWDLLVEAQQGGHIPAPRIATFATAVDATAAEGDPKANAIITEAGAQLAALVLDMAAQTSFDTTPIPLVCTGGVFHSHRLSTALEERLTASPIAFTSHPVILEPITGLVRLLQRDITIRKF